MILSPRLRCIVDFVLPEKKLADIGTDHALIPIELVKSHLVPSVIATDINDLPLERARADVKSHGLNDIIDLRRGPGLEVLDTGEVEQVIIAGMGGRMISTILDNSTESAQSLSRLILQPMTGVSELREYLLNHDFAIEKDVVVSEGKHFYHVLVCSPGEMVAYDSFDIEFGYRPARVLDEDYYDYLAYQREILQKRIENMSDSQNEKTIERRREFERRLIYISNLYESIKNSSSY